MVLPPSFAAEGQAAQAGWLRVLRRWLHLGRKGVIVAIRRAQPARLRELVEALEAVEPGFRFVDRAEELLECEAGELVVLGLRAEDLTWLNLNRPIFAQRKLRAVLWAEGELNVELKFRAPDMHDWVSHFVDCPPGVPAHAVEGLEMGLEWWPGVAWTGEGFDAAWAELGRGEAPPRERADLDYGELVEQLARTGELPVRAWMGVETHRALTKLRWAIAESGYEGANVLLEPAISTPGWFPVSSACMSLASAAARLREGGVEDPCRAAAWLGLEPEAVELFARWGVMPPREREKREALVRERVSEAEIEAVVSLARSGLLLRALHGDARVVRGREELVGLLNAGTEVVFDRHELGVWVSQGRHGLTPLLVLPKETLPDYAVEMTLRSGPVERYLSFLVPTATWMGYEDVAESWVLGNPDVGVVPRDSSLVKINAKLLGSLDELLRSVRRSRGKDSELPAEELLDMVSSVLTLVGETGWHRQFVLQVLLRTLKLLAGREIAPNVVLHEVLASARAQLGATDPDYLRLLHLTGAYAMLAWPELGAELLLDERSLAGEELGSPAHREQRVLAWAHALLSRGRFSEAVELLEPHAAAHPPVARLLARALLRRGDRAAAERLAARHDLPDLAEIESQPLEDERRTFFREIVDAFMADGEVDANSR
jgi:hypothetical protein